MFTTANYSEEYAAAKRRIAELEAEIARLKGCRNVASIEKSETQKNDSVGLVIFLLLVSLVALWVLTHE